MRAGIYNRCSTEEEAQMNALEIQAEESREIVQRKGWTIAEQYIESQSGTSCHGRNEYKRLLEDMEKNLFDVVVIKSIDRLTRSAKDWYLFLDSLTRNEMKLYIYIDCKFYTPQDSLLAGIKAILAEDFSRELSKKIKNAHRRRQKKKSGLNITVPMFGWDKIGKDNYIINEAEAKIYREAFQMAEAGKGFYSIANIMYDRGVRGKSGKRISQVQWRKMLYSPRAHGTVILHTTEYDFESKKTRAVPQSEWIVMKNALPQIVDAEYQEKVLKMLQKRNEVRMRNTEREKSELSGKLYCAECGEPYYRKKGKKTQWKCATTLEQGKQKCLAPAISEEKIMEDLKKAYRTQNSVLFAHEEEMIRETAKKLQVDESELEDIRWANVLRKVERVMVCRDGNMEFCFYKQL